MKVESDFSELLALFNARGIEYVIGGGYALAFHGAPKYTGKLDLLVRADEENAKRVLAALDAFGLGSLAVSVGDLTTPDRVVQLGVPPVRVDLVTSIDGVTWEEAWTGRAPGAYGDVPVSFLGRAEFVRNKRTTGRHKDLADIEALGET